MPGLWAHVGACGRMWGRGVEGLPLLVGHIRRIWRDMYPRAFLGSATVWRRLRHA